MPPKPQSSRGLALLTALIAIHQAITAVRVLQLPPELAATLTIPPPLEFIASSGWSLLFAWITFHLLLSAHARTGWFLLAFVTYSLLRLFLFAQADYDQQRYPFLVTVSAIILLGWAILRRITNGDYSE